MKLAIKAFNDTTAEAHALRQLLGRSPRGVVQSRDGSYAGLRLPVSDEDLAAHLAGAYTVGLSVVFGGKGHFVGLDIDERFRERLSYIAAVIERRGLTAASIATSGSDPGRGKVVMFFAKAKSATSLRSLGHRILEEARAQAAGGPWGIERPGKMSVYPLGGNGGLLRIAGRNFRPDRHATALDVLFSLDGEPRGFADVVPATKMLLLDPLPIPPAPRGAWVGKMLSTGVSYANGGSVGVLRNLCRLAKEAARLYGSGEIGRNTFFGWCSNVWVASPDQRGPSPSGDDRAERSWQRRCEEAWQWAALDTFYYPGGLPRSGKENVSSCGSCRRVLEMLKTYASQKGLTPDAFCCSYRQIAKHVGIAQPKTARKHVGHLVSSGFVVVHDRGISGSRGQPAIFGLVSEGDSQESVLVRGAKRGNVRERLRIRVGCDARRREYDDAKPEDFDRIEDLDEAA